MGNVTICKAHSDCFANRGGVCACLKNNEFDGRDCPFYKTAGTVPEERRSRKHKGGSAYGNQ